MEGQQNTESLITLGSITLVMIVVLFIVLLIGMKRRLFVKQSTIDLLENECKKEIQKLKDEITILKSKLRDHPKSSENPEKGVTKS